MIPFILSVTAILTGITHFMLMIPISRADLVVFGLLSLIAAIAVCGFAYAGLWIACACSLAGVVSGIGFMTYIFTKPIEWVGIVGLVSGVQLAFIFFLIGVCIQMLCYLSNKRGKTNGRKC